MDRNRFENLWNRCRVDGVDADPQGVFEELARCYSGSNRRYHTPGHIEHCLHQFDLASHLMDDRDTVEMALWFHDAIWEAQAKEGENERRSAELFLRLVGESVSPAFRHKVYDLIMVTTHRALPSAGDEQFMVDVDLSSFGLPWDEFVRDSVAVRDEYPDVPDDEFFPKQHRFFAGLLAREHFCFTEFFRKRYEKSARENIGRHLQQLEKQGYA